jgi:hypothetical protein
MKDFGNDAFSNDAFSNDYFDTVGKLKNLNCGNPKDFIGILKIINYDLHLGMSGDDNYASPVISMLLRPVRKSKPNLTPQPKNLKKDKTLFYCTAIIFDKRNGVLKTIQHHA